jgi:hypothetical protein
MLHRVEHTADRSIDVGRRVQVHGSDGGPVLRRDVALRHHHIRYERLDLPMVVGEVREPLGQAELRDMLWQALTRVDGEHRPTLIDDPKRAVFQYLGTISRPAEIAFTSRDHQIAYDFRDRRARIDRATWQPPDALLEAQRSAWRDLVTTWERMILSRQQRATRTP